MNEITCENVLIAKMAEIDGEETEISAERISSHLATCENCSQEIARMQSADNLLKRQARQEQRADLWPAIEAQIGAKETSRNSWKPFALLGALLVAYKLLEMLPEQSFGLAFNLIPLVLIVVTFLLLKENPFRINDGLVLEKNHE